MALNPYGFVAALLMNALWFVILNAVKNPLGHSHRAWGAQLLLDPSLRSG
ncbi:MAG: hypothetical protein ABIZ81_12670 [Opitutaceae bacterium]